MTNLLQTNYISLDESQIMEKQINELIEHSIVSNDYNCENSEIGNIRKNMCQLRREHNLKWVEQAALFYKMTAICLMQKEDDQCTDYFDRAIALYQWMCEDSRYLHLNYFSDLKAKREEIEKEIDFIGVQKETWSIITRKFTLEYIENSIGKLEHSGYLCKYDTKTTIITHLLEQDSETFKDHIPTFIKIIYLLNENNLLQDFHKQRIEKTIERHITLRETEIAEMWFSDKQEEYDELLKNNILETSALLLLAEQDAELQYPKNVLSARICRYLTKFENPYTSQLKNKAYTLLTGECSLKNHFDWEDLLSFNLAEFTCKIVNLLIEELEGLANTDENKWEQYSNGQNTLTLDKDGFTLSNLFPKPIRSWKAKKDKASLINNLASIVSFGKPTYLFERCNSIADHYLYWKQFQNEFPLYQPETVRTTPVRHCSAPAENAKEARQPQKQYPGINDEVTIGIVKINTKGEYWEGIILDKLYRGTKVILPYTQLNACYFRIKGFTQLLSVNDSLKVKVMEINDEGIRVSLAQFYNEYTYAENMQRKQMPAMLADCEDGKLKWLLPTGATAVTTTYRWIKPHIGDFYKVEFQGTSGGTMRALIDVCQVKASVTESEFQAEIMKHLLEFKAFTRQLQKKEQIQQQEQSILKQKNNPFAALQSLKTILEDTDQQISTCPDEDETNETENLSSLPSVTMSRHTAEELVYCLELFIQEITEPIERLDAYCFMQLLCHFVGYEETAAYYQICADYLYDIHSLALKPSKEKFTEENIHDFNILQARMEQIGIERYASTLEKSNQIIQLLRSMSEKDYTHIQRMMKHENKTISELARYFSMIPYLGNEDNELQEIIYKCINKLLGYTEVHRKEVTAPTAAFFGHEGVKREFKSTAFIHPDKNAGEAQIVVLARVLASFMNTDGGTLYIGVNDNGYLGGLETDLKKCHYDSDVYLRSVNIGLIRKLGDGKEDQNRYQDYIRCAVHEYNDGRMVLAFRVPPLNEVVKVNGNVYTRSGSSTIIKPMENVKDFIAQRREASLDSTPCMPEFPTLFNETKKEYTFNESETTIIPASIPTQEMVEEKRQKPVASDKKKKAHIDIYTSTLRPNPLQKKADMGYTNTFQFVSLFTNGKIACSPSPKIGVWGETDGKVIFSYDMEGNEELLVSVFRNGEVGISNLKKGFSQSNAPIAFLPSLDDLLFASPATPQDYLLLIAEKDDEKRYRLIRLTDFEKPLGIQPKLTTILTPEKGTYIFAEILHADQLEDIENEKLSLNSFDIYNAGRLWEHTDYKKDISIITELCKLNF